MHQNRFYSHSVVYFYIDHIVTQHEYLTGMSNSSNHSVRQSEPSQRVAVYCRVSTSQQTTENQTYELARVADLRGWTIVETFRDDGISGSKGRNDRPALDRMLKKATQRKFDLIAVWSIDRLGRSLQHLVETVNELHSVGVEI